MKNLTTNQLVYELSKRLDVGDYAKNRNLYDRLAFMIAVYEYELLQEPVNESILH